MTTRPTFPNANLEIMRETVARFQKLIDAYGEQGALCAPVVADELIDLGDTMAEAFSAIDDQMTRGATLPDSWDWTS
jgi:hypothetical protein